MSILENESFPTLQDIIHPEYLGGLAGAELELLARHANEKANEHPEFPHSVIFCGYTRGTIDDDILLRKKAIEDSLGVILRVFLLEKRLKLACFFAPVSASLLSMHELAIRENKFYSQLFQLY